MTLHGNVRRNRSRHSRVAQTTDLPGRRRQKVSTIRSARDDARLSYNVICSLIPRDRWTRTICVADR